MVMDGKYTCLDEHCVIYKIVKSLCHTPEINTTSYVNYISIIKFKLNLKRNKIVRGG